MLNDYVAVHEDASTELEQKSPAEWDSPLDSDEISKRGCLQPHPESDVQSM